MGHNQRLVLAAGLLALLPLYFLGLARVPFHPDETSLLFQSRDLGLLFSQPQSVLHPQRQPELKENSYRILNAPLAKYVFAAARGIAGVGIDQVGVDWDWSESFKANREAGAIPPPEALTSARFASTLLLFLSLPVLYLAGRELGGPIAGLGGVTVYALNALVLLHGRRAMAEGTMLLTLSLAIWLAFRARHRPVPAGIAAGLALASKHSVLPVVLSAWIAASGLIEGRRFAWKKLVQALVATCATFYLLTPHLWLHPLDGMLSTLSMRRELLTMQVQLTQELAPAAVLSSPGSRLTAMLGQLFFLPPQFQEVGNYSVELAGPIADYTRTSTYALMRGMAGGGLVLALVLLGLVSTVRPLEGSSEDRSASLGILMLATLAQTVVLLATIRVPVQRYYLPLFPIMSLWAGLGVNYLWQGILRVWRVRTKDLGAADLL